MDSLGKAVPAPGRIYVTGGVSAVLMGWREMTVDIDIKADPEPAGLFQALPELKEKLDINLELACPSDFIPPLPGWESRSLFVQRCGKIDFYHYDFYSQALSKLERFHSRDQFDIAHMLADALIEKPRLSSLFTAILPDLIRFPAIDIPTFTQRVADFTG